MSRYTPKLPDGLTCDPPRWKLDVLRIGDPVSDLVTKGTTFGWGIGVARRAYADVAEGFNPGGMIHAYWSWMLQLRMGRRAVILYRWIERVAGA